MANPFAKDPLDVLDYLFDFSADMAADGDTIVSHTITIDDGLTLDSSTSTATGVIAWISGGTLGQLYKADCLVTTAAGRSYSRKAEFTLQDL